MDSQEETFDTTAAIKAQRDYCKENSMPHFAPSNGVCWACRSQIYESRSTNVSGNKSHKTGISVQSAGERLITGCPHCKKSYCD